MLIEGQGDCVRSDLTYQRAKRLMTRASGRWFMQEPGAQREREVTKTHLRSMIETHMFGKEINMVVLSETKLIPSVVVGRKGRTIAKWAFVGWKTWEEDPKFWIDCFRQNRAYFDQHYPYLSRSQLVEIAVKLDSYGTDQPLKAFLLERKC